MNLKVEWKKIGIISFDYGKQHLEVNHKTEKTKKEFFLYSIIAVWNAATLIFAATLTIAPTVNSMCRNHNLENNAESQIVL